MELEIQKIISENLPEQVGVVLRKRLERADNDASAIIALQEELEKQHKEINQLESLVNELKNRLSKYMELEYWEADLEKRQRNMEIEILKIRLEESEKRNSIGTSLVEQVFKSPVYRKYVESRDHGTYDLNGRYSVTHSTPISETSSIH